MVALRGFFRVFVERLLVSAAKKEEKEKREKKEKRKREGKEEEREEKRGYGCDLLL